MNEFGIERHAHMCTRTHTEKQRKKIKRANGKVILFVRGMAMTRAGHRQWSQAAGCGWRAPRAAAGWPADLVRGAGGRRRGSGRASVTQTHSWGNKSQMMS